MALPKTETFTNTTGTTLASHDAGWTQQTGSFEIYNDTNGRLQGAGGENNYAVWTTDQPGAAQYAECDVTTLTGADSYLGLVLRGASGAFTCVRFMFRSNATVCDVITAGSSGGQIGSAPTPPVAGDRVRAEINSSNVMTVYYDSGGGWVQKYSETMTGAPSSGYGGIVGYGASQNTLIDNWEVGNLDIGVSLPLFVNANQPTL